MTSSCSRTPRRSRQTSCTVAVTAVMGSSSPKCEGALGNAPGSERGERGRRPAVTTAGRRRRHPRADRGRPRTVPSRARDGSRAGRRCRGRGRGRRWRRGHREGPGAHARCRPDGRSHASEGRHRTTQAIKDLIPHAKILMLTISDEEADLYDAIKAGANGYLLKEISIEEVANAIRS